MMTIEEIEKELKDLAKKQSELEDKRKILKSLQPKNKYADYKQSFDKFGVKLTKQSGKYYAINKEDRLLALLTIKPEVESERILNNLLMLLEMLTNLNEHIDGKVTISSLPNNLVYNVLYASISTKKFHIHLRASIEENNIDGTLSCSKQAYTNCYIIDENKKYNKSVSVENEEDLEITWTYRLSTTKDKFVSDCVIAIDDLINIIIKDEDNYEDDYEDN